MLFDDGLAAGYFCFMPNIEMKARFTQLDNARATALELGGRYLWKDEQVDTYFNTRVGKLKLRQSGLNGSELIPYLKTDRDGLKHSEYVRLPAEDPALVERLLGQLLGTGLTVRKTREVYLIGNVRVHLDEVEGLGAFLEFEAVFDADTEEARNEETRKVAELMQRFGVRPSDLFDASYPELLRADSSQREASNKSTADREQ